MKLRRQNPDLVTVERDTGYYITTKYFSCCRIHKFTMKVCLGNTQYFYLVDNDVAEQYTENSWPRSHV